MDDELITLSIPASSVKRFYAVAKQFTGERLGQAFYNYFDLHKCSSHYSFRSKLYEADGKEARELIEQITDHSQ